MNIPATVASVTYSCSPPLERSIETLAMSRSHYLALSADQEPLFLRQGDYWVVRYEGQIAFLRATRGLHCLSILLRHPGREFHVSELAGQVIDRRGLMEKASNAAQSCQVKRLSDAGPILDAQAKTQYKHRLDDLRSDLNEAERLNDNRRAEEARTEMKALAEQLAAAVGLGGRDRRLGSETERARCAVTKRIKDSICKIGEAIPSLRRHLVSQIKTGYFCSYGLSQEHPVAWRFLILLTALCCDTESYIVT